MKALLCKTLGMPDQMVVEEIPDPVPGPGQVLVEMKAAGVNFPDALVIQGKYQFKPPLPFSPGSELAGVVVAMGEGVKGVKLGQHVICSCQYGAFAQKVIVDGRQLIPMPPGMPFDVAASFTLTYGTSYHGIKGRANLKAGETMLVLGAAGGVGLAAIQIGKALGARVIAAASTPEKLAVCKENGADDLINYSTEDMRERLKELTGGKGPDVIYDPVGGEYAEPAFRSIAWGGRYLVIGFANGDIPALPFNLPLLKGASIMGVFWGEFVKRQLPDFIKDLPEMFGLISKDKLRPHISGRYPLEQGAQALQDLLDRKVTGKVVITNGEAAEVSAGKTAPTHKPASDAQAEVKADTPMKPGDMAALVGKEIGLSSWITLDQERINEFARCTQDEQWIHVDVERAAKEGPFGTTVAHAFLSLSMIPVTMYELLGGKVQVQASLNYGLDKVRFMSPVKSGKRVRNRVKLLAIEGKGMGRWLVTTENTFEIEGESKPAIVAVNLGYLIE